MSTYRVYVLYQHQCFAIFEVASIYISIVLKISIVLEKADEHSSMVYFSVQWTLDSKSHHFLFTLQGDMFLSLSFFLGILSIFYSFSFVAGRFWVHDILSFWILPIVGPYNHLFLNNKWLLPLTRKHLFEILYKF